MGRSRKQRHGKPEAQGKHSSPGADSQLTRQAATSWKHHNEQFERERNRIANRKPRKK